MKLAEVDVSILTPALALLPPRMDSPAARVMLLAIGQQESRFVYRKQVGGPARGFWQFEEGGGVKGVLTHPATASLAAKLCDERKVILNRASVYAKLALDDLLAAGFARLLLFSDPRALPSVTDAQAAWECYIRNWRPGKPHRDTWDRFHAAACVELGL